MYAIVDVETTGGKFNEEGITEIAIYRHDGQKVVDSFDSLINPERKIQPFVQRLTGIDNEMVARAPKFHEVAKRIVEITEGCVLVAHNASFDYRMLRLEFDRLGYFYEKESLCTVHLSQKLIPDMPSYSLGKLVRSLNIPMDNRHRASGDALATVELFNLLLKKDRHGNQMELALKKRTQNKMDLHLRRLVEECPTTMGVYYLYDKQGNILYIGKSRNIRKRVTQHFQSNAKRSKELRELVHSVSFQVTGSELLALIIENQEIKAHCPPFNKALKKQRFSHTITSYQDDDGYRLFSISKNPPADREVLTTFSSLKSAKNFLERMVDRYGLCPKLSGLQTGAGGCFDFHLKKCTGACVGMESVSEYNTRADAVYQKYYWPAEKSLVIVDRGRIRNEKTAIVIQCGKICGYAFIDMESTIEKISDVEPLLTKIEHDRDTRHIVQSHLRNKNVERIIYTSDV